MARVSRVCLNFCSRFSKDHLDGGGAADVLREVGGLWE